MFYQHLVSINIQGEERVQKQTCLLIDVPVQAVILENKPVLLPLLRKVTLRISLSPQPALAVSSAQRLAGNTPPTQGGQTSPWNKNGDKRRIQIRKTSQTAEHSTDSACIVFYSSVYYRIHKTPHPNVGITLSKSSA